MRTVDELLDVCLGLTFIGFIRTDVHRLVLILACHGDDCAWHGCREQHGLATIWGVSEETFDVRKESEVEHFVGLVENHEANVAEVELLLLREVNQTAGGADDDLGTGFDFGDLTLVGLATVNGGHCGRAVRASQLEVFGDLNAELAGRHDNQGLSARFRVRAENLNQRKAETEGFTGSGLGLANNVLAG